MHSKSTSGGQSMDATAPTTTPDGHLTKAEYERLANLRYVLRRFARLTELGAIDHDIAGDDQTVSTLAPAGVELFDSLVRRILLVAEPFAQCGFHDPIGQHLAARQRQRVVQASHMDVPFRWAARNGAV